MYNNCTCASSQREEGNRRCATISDKGEDMDVVIHCMCNVSRKFFGKPFFVISSKAYEHSICARKMKQIVYKLQHERKGCMVFDVMLFL